MAETCERCGQPTRSYVGCCEDCRFLPAPRSTLRPRACAACGRLFQHPDTRRRCCSAECSREYNRRWMRDRRRAKRRARPCEVCGTPFLAPLHRGKRKTCSRRCYLLRQSSRDRRRRQAQAEKRTPLTCRSCQAEFRPTRAGGQRCCSPECSRQWMLQRLRLAYRARKAQAAGSEV